ncbi:hypothetical protein [Bacillus thuringiensis]|nr:hypothetical protein [Bacillus thuringiensis]
MKMLPWVLYPSFLKLGGYGEIWYFFGFVGERDVGLVVSLGDNALEICR